MERFGIYSPTMGQREDFPNILINKAFTVENSNVQLWDGMIRSAKMRSVAIGRAPLPVKSLEVGNVFKIDGDHTVNFTENVEFIAVSSNEAEGYGVSRGTFTLSIDATYDSTDTTITVDEDTSAILTGDVIIRTTGGVAVDTKIKAPDGNPFIKYLNHIYGNGTTQVLLGFTKAHIYKYTSSTESWDLIFTSSGTTDHWSVAEMNDKVLATNNVDLPLVWENAGNFTGLDAATSGIEVATGQYITKAKCVTVYNNFAIFGNVVIDGATLQPSNIYWSDLDDETEWKAEDAGAAQVEGKGDITEFGTNKEYLYIFKTKSIERCWYSGTALIWTIDPYSDAIGSKAPGSIIGDEDDNLYFFGSDNTFRELALGRISQPIIKTTRSITPSLISGIRAAYISDYDEIMWSVPIGPTATANNKVLKYKDAKWAFADIAITAFGDWSQVSTFTWDTIPFSTWQSWGWESWDSADGSVDSLIDICSDADGATYSLHSSHLDDGSEFTGSFVLSTDFADKKALPYKKRLLVMELYLMNMGAGTMNISIKRDNEAEWQSIGTVSLDGNTEILRPRITVEKAAHSFQIKFESATAFEFVGVEFEWVPWGAR